MTVNLVAATVTLPDTTYSRSLGAHLGDVVNVKDFGARGDNAHDDTAAIQAAINYAFGPPDDPHGYVLPDGPTQNRALFFPPGYYKVSSPYAPWTITNCTNAGGYIRLTVASTAGLIEGDIVFVRGVTGTTYANACFGVFNLTATQFTLRGSTFNAAWTGGGTFTVAALQVRDVMGGHIYGSGRYASIIYCEDFHTAAIATNGFSFSKVENIGFAAETGGIAFDLNADGGGLNLQSNQFNNVQFGGTGSATPKYGVTIGMGQQMGSENSFLTCYYSGTEAGMYVANFNSLSNSVIGGNFSACKIGIHVAAGSCPIIQGVGFQNYQVAGQIADIYIANGAGDSYLISGCRTESSNFIKSGPTLNYSVLGCAQTTSASEPLTGGVGAFFAGSGYVTLSGCQSNLGYIQGNAYLMIDNCSFGDPNYLFGGGFGINLGFLQITPMPVTTQTGTTYTMHCSDGGSRVLFNNASPITVTLSGAGGFQLGPGSKIEVQQTGAGQVTFAGASGLTINSRGGRLKLAGQHASATLTCVVANTAWVLEGDVTT